MSTSVIICLSLSRCFMNDDGEKFSFNIYEYVCLKTKRNEEEEEDACNHTLSQHSGFRLFDYNRCSNE